jgi:hypothetical protein
LAAGIRARQQLAAHRCPLGRQGQRERGSVFLFRALWQASRSLFYTQAIKSRGDWIYGVIDPAAGGRSQIDGEHSSKLVPAMNTVEAEIYTVWQLMSSGRLKVFRSLGNWLPEFRLYQCDKDGKILKQNDHLMDRTRYFVVSARENMSIKPEPDYDQPRQTYSPGEHNFAWMN